MSSLTFALCHLTCSNVLTILTAIFTILCLCLTYLNILIWTINFIIKSITRNFIMLNTMMRNETTSFASLVTSLDPIPEIMLPALKYYLLKF